MMFLFPKKEKLCKEKTIQRLFENGQSITEAPFRIIWNFEGNKDEVFVKLVVVVSKKKMKLSTKRNHIKRKIREVYRIQKNKLEHTLKMSNQQLALAILYQEDRIFEFNTIQKKLEILLTRLINKL